MLTKYFSPIKRGIQLMRQDRYGEAVDYFLRMIEQKKNLPVAHFNLGRCFFKLGLFEDAKKHLLERLNFRLTPLDINEILEITNWRQLVTHDFFNASPSFSADGSRLAYVSAKRDTNGDGKIDALDCGGIFILDIATGEEKLVVPDDYYNSTPVFSPDGAHIAYLSSRQVTASANIPDRIANPGLYLIDIASGEERLLVDNTHKIKNISFSNDGEKIYFTCWRPGDQYSGIFSLEVNTGKMESVIGGFFENTFPSISRSGHKLIYSSWRTDTNNDNVIDLKDNSAIYMKNLLIGFETLIAPDAFNNTFPVISNDELKIMYLSVRRDTNGDGKINSIDNSGIYIYDMEKQKEFCLIDDKSFNKFASFTPDGNTVIFVSSWRINRMDLSQNEFFENKGIYAINVDGKNLRQIVSDKYYGSRSPVVSPTGDAIAYVSWRKNTARGLYLAYTNKLPTIDELRSWIENNLK